MSPGLFFGILLFFLGLLFIAMAVLEWLASRRARRSGSSLTQLAWIEFHVRRGRRCSITKADAAWMADALHELNCPACSAPLAKHRR